MTRRSFLANLTGACAALGLPVAVRAFPPILDDYGLPLLKRRAFFAKPLGPPREERDLVSVESFGYIEKTFTIMQKGTREGMIFQWRTNDGIAMSPVFRSMRKAADYDGPFEPQAA